MQILKRENFRRVLNLRTHTARRCACGGQRRETWNIVTNCGAAYGLLVVEGFAPQWSINDQIYFSSFYEVHDIRAAFICFVNCFRGHSCRLQRGDRTACSNQVESHRDEIGGERADVLLIVIIHAKKYGS